MTFWQSVIFSLVFWGIAALYDAAKGRSTWSAIVGLVGLLIAWLLTHVRLA